MTEEYESDVMSVSYLKERNTLCLVWKGSEIAKDTDYKTLLMHTSELIRKHECDSVIVDGNMPEHLCDNDVRWGRKILVPALEAAGLHKIVFVGGIRGFDSLKLNDRFVCLDAANLDEAKAEIPKVFKPSPEILQMSREEAVSYLGLKDDANDFAIDEKFWQLSKRYRGDDTPESEQKLADVSCAYDIACGRRDEVRKETQINASRRKFLGKNASEWKTYFSYTWLRWLIIAIAAVCAFLLVKQIFFTKAYDCSVVSFGHFEYDNTNMTASLTAEGYTKPYVTSVDIVVPNDQNQSSNAYADQTFAAVMSSSPDMIVTDDQTYGYYFSYLADMSTVYDDLKDYLPKDVYDSLKPVYMSERDSVELSNSYIEDNVINKDIEDASDYSDTPVMVGLEITDPDMIKKLGYTNLWPDSAPSVVIGMYCDTTDVATCEKVMIAVLGDAI